MIAGLSRALAANATGTKNALESFIASNGGITMPETDQYGHTSASNLDLGLYLIVETSVPENVTCTTDPFLASVPMTTINSDATVVYGDSGNPNDVTLTWQRSNTDYYDTLQDDCHFYTYGIDLLKKFSDGAGDYAQVQMVVHDDTDNYCGRRGHLLYPPPAQS